MKVDNWQVYKAEDGPQNNHHIPPITPLAHFIDQHTEESTMFRVSQLQMLYYKKSNYFVFFSLSFSAPFFAEPLPAAMEMEDTAQVALAEDTAATLAQ